jgi:hypothetical protein
MEWAHSSPSATPPPPSPPPPQQAVMQIPDVPIVGYGGHIPGLYANA